ncbi:MAG: BsaWI family type II restriction enzyme [Proteobacteria bacterium]|nr:BsaWI family type II restriction enzyme [Pseudomonadota bacterium]
MARLECKSSQRGIASAWVEVDHVTDKQVASARARLDELLAKGGQVSDAVATAYVELTTDAPKANPSDLWQHVIYRHLLEIGWSDQRWKRVSGFALERVFVSLYQPRLLPNRIRMHILSKGEANALIEKLGIKDIQASKVDLFIEGQRGDEWLVFGAAHVKSSIAERIQDDVPASLAFMEKGLLSIAITMDMKSYPPPHGNCVNYGELGGRSMEADKDKIRVKRNYIEKTGQFDAMFSFNLRTPASPETTESGKRIFTMSVHDQQPDALVRLLSNHWTKYQGGVEV